MAGATHALTLPGPVATAALAQALAPALHAGDLLALWGDLGVGKTSFARALITARTGERVVPSPTYTLVQAYDGAPPIWHLDLYRLRQPEEVLDLGLDEALGEAIVLIEWPERLGALLPFDRLDLRFAYAGAAEERDLVLAGHGAWEARLDALLPALRAALA
ncbi:MAG: tRNA (adenosine(37)-N6)-threonylcarbamoyltransferase complex ATPase subunit type 1 TsaE [Alphaproteobacteria bacterium]|nr:tRNA (adenosine(37)-N6)-threonylcarbamoyltransferase complex ATPase subunit type 1 TsaE [Alphaproteobacteria bacterium]